MANYYVVVSRIAEPKNTISMMSGKLWARNSSDAEIEAGKYREDLNSDGTNFIVMALRYDIAQDWANYHQWCNHRVTTNPSTPPGMQRLRTPR